MRSVLKARWKSFFQEFLNRGTSRSRKRQPAPHDSRKSSLAVVLAATRQLPFAVRTSFTHFEMNGAERTSWASNS
jgi:hypothetical protein